MDLPPSDTTVVAALAGLQTFTGDNVRLHLRGNAIQVIDADLDLSAQLRGQYFTTAIRVNSISIRQTGMHRFCQQCRCAAS